MKIIFLFLIIIPNFFNYELIDLNIHSKLEPLLKKLKTEIPSFIIDIKEKIGDFKEMAFETQQEVLNDLNNTVKGLIKEIKETKENVNENIKEFIEKSTKIAGFLAGRDCGILDYIPFYECSDIKKYILSQILETINEEFKCSEIVNMITTDLISNDLSYNLKSILFFILTLSSNPDALIEGSAQILYDAINCFQEKYDIFWPQIEKNLKIDEISSDVKKDLFLILIYSITNIVEIFRNEEKEGLLSKFNDLIYNDLAKNLQKTLLSYSKVFNEFGTNFYNISSSFALNVTINPGGLGLTTDSNLFISDFNNKGIKVILHTNYLLRMKGAYAMQTIVFDSPLISIKGKREVENGVSNYFVGITLFDKNGSKIVVSDINIEDFRPQILFEKKLYNTMKTCLFYDEENNKLDNEGIKTEMNYILKGKSYIRCIPKKLAIFTIGESEVKFYDLKVIYIFIMFLFIILAFIVGFVILRKKTSKKTNNLDIEKSPTNKKNYIGLEEEEEK